MSSGKRNPESLKQFLRARRPERFSDSAIQAEASLDRSLLEYHLETLTSRSQELEFEEFARSLAEREICPNLLPQTGPMGGGDSKADTETYPVADALSIGWFTGIGREAGSERWAFAISTKKDWKAKVKSDVAGIVTTGRDYKKIFFISSRFIRSKFRAQAEDELSRKYHVDVRILDRTWILNKVFTNNREGLAIEKLGIAITPRSIVVRGPLDTDRQRELSAIESNLRSALEQGRCDYRTALDSLRAADLARSLELPRSEVEGRYERAERICQNFGTQREILRCAYERAWTAYWWYQDFRQFLDFYSQLEQLVRGSLNVYDIEFIFNLNLLLQTAVSSEFVKKDEAQLETHTDSLFADLSRLANDPTRPSTSLQARTLMLLSTLSRATEPHERTKLLRELHDVIRRCEGLAGYPFESFVAILTEMQPIHEGYREYDDLFDTVVRLTSKRQGEVRAGELLLERGTAQFFQKRPYDAIRTLGKSIMLLFKDESHYEMVRALYMCGCSYERVGLLWAARGSLLNAASLCLNRTSTHGQIGTTHAALFNRLKWVEVQLGRIAQALAWHELELATHATLGLPASEKQLEDHVEFDATLGILFLRTDLWNLRRLTKLPSCLTRLELDGAALALLFALGYENEAIDGVTISDIWGEGAPEALFAEWESARAFAELPSHPQLCEESRVNFHSNILGCKVSVDSANCAPCIDVAESLLAALESLASTCLESLIVSREPKLTFSISRSDFSPYPFEYEFTLKEGRPHFSVLVSTFNPHTRTSDEQAGLKSRLLELLIGAFGRIVTANESPSTLAERLWNESAVQRSIDFTGTFVTVGNIFGGEQPRNVSKWLGTGDKDFPIRRSAEWKPNFDQDQERRAANAKFAGGDAEPPSELNLANIRHTEVETLSLISEPLWNKAEWYATAFAVPIEMDGLPILAPVFRNISAADEIFSAWRMELGKEDKRGLLRVTIIRGVDEKNVNAYRVIIGTNPEALNRNKAKFAVYVSRINCMRPTSPENLSRFLLRYGRRSEYLLMPGFSKGTETAFGISPKNAILKRDLNIRDAWQISRHDPDSVGIHVDDRPLIPEQHSKDAPVYGLLQWKRSRSSAG